MPRVPTGPDVDLQPLPNVYARAPRSQLPELGAGLQRAGADLGGIAIAEQHQRNADRIFRTDAQLKSDYLQFETSLQDRRGQQAWGVTDDVDKWFEDSAEGYAAELENDEQRRLFGQSFEKLRLQSRDSAFNYEREQRRISTEESARASIVNSANIAAAQHNNLDAVGGAKTDILARIQVLSNLNGWTPERRQAEEGAQLTNLHKQVIQAKIDADPVGAAAYFEANQGEIAGVERDAIGKLVRQGTIRGKAQVATDEIMAAGLSRTEALAEARKRFTGEEEDEVITRLHVRFSEMDAARASAEKATADEAWDLFARVGSVSKLPVSLVDRLDGRTLTALRREEKARIQGNDIPTDWGVYYDLKQAASDTPADFLALDLRQHFDKLNPTERRNLIQLQQSLRDKENSNDVTTLNKQLAVVHEQLGWKTSDKEKKGKFDSIVFDVLNAEQKRTGGKKLGFEERQKIIDQLLIEGEVASGRWYAPDRDRRLYEVVGTEDIANFTPEVPDEERKKIEAALTRRGREVTDAEVLRLYRLKAGV